MVQKDLFLTDTLERPQLVFYPTTNTQAEKMTYKGFQKYISKSIL